MDEVMRIHVNDIDNRLMLVEQQVETLMAMNVTINKILNSNTESIGNALKILAEVKNASQKS